MNIQENVPLAPLTTFRVGGVARFFIEIESVQDLQGAHILAQKEGYPVFVLGGGSNVLISDDGYSGIVLHVKIGGVSFIDDTNSVLVVAGSGVPWDTLVEKVTQRGYWGIENLSGIPGYVGGSVVQNIGAYGVEVGERVEWVEVYDPQEDVNKKISKEQCLFDYRDSIFKKALGKNLVITRVAYRLEKDGVPNLSYKDLQLYSHQTSLSKLDDVRRAVLDIRSKKFPDLKKIGTAGSFFKNPITTTSRAEMIKKEFPDMPMYIIDEKRVKLSSAWIIDHILHMRGIRDGTVGCWDEQALVLVNYGDAHASEIFFFAKKISEMCEEKINFPLSPEVVFIGDDFIF